MSLENGDRILDYEDLENCLKMYKLDNKIFEKASIMLNLYMNQPSWPHSFDVYENECLKILGGSPYWIGRIGCQLIPHFENKENSQIESNFKKDLAFFSENTWLLLDSAYYDRANPLGLSSLSSSQSNNGDIIVRISRSDKISLDLSLTKYDLNKMIKFLKDLSNQEDNLDE